ncbi:uncharacterized protein EMH_0060820 [Eimeria mitis]|uniref:Uncharacterized protein n=1 Tax=Eimeria mitis TaxID=44415 RepID=U6JZ09_9EIME|nr:uncharacterized protein EMH_0060820 [Eimeria mitis]CDJ30720.1 hypothetical protein, conserved [Eimeria mitis]
MISTTFNVLSFIFNSAMRMHMRQSIRKSLDEGSEARDMELFGLKWGELSAEETLGGADMKRQMLDEQLDKWRKRRQTKTKKPPEKQPGAASETDAETTADEGKGETPVQPTEPSREGREGKAKEPMGEESEEKNPFVTASSSTDAEVIQKEISAETMEEEVGLKKIIRRFRMLKLFGVIAASFLVQNADKISALVKGTIQFSVSTLDSTLFFAMLLNAITKPVYGLYFAYQGLLEDKTRTEAIQEFRHNQKALTNFLMGSAAMESQVGQVKAFDLPGPELQEIMFTLLF